MNHNIDCRRVYAMTAINFTSIYISTLALRCTAKDSVDPHSGRLSIFMINYQFMYSLYPFLPK